VDGYAVHALMDNDADSVHVIGTGNYHRVDGKAD
jgi:hypothetical protein